MQADTSVGVGEWESTIVHTEGTLMVLKGGQCITQSEGVQKDDLFSKI